MFETRGEALTSFLIFVGEEQVLFIKEGLAGYRQVQCEWPDGGGVD